MTQRNRRSSNKKQEISYAELMKITGNRNPNELNEQEWNELGLPKLGFGDWLGRNWGNALQIAGGAALALTTPITGPAGLAGIGMMTSGVSGMASDATQQKQIQAQTQAQNEQTALMQQQNELAIRNQNLQGNIQPTYGAVMKCGGRIKKMRAGGNISDPIPNVPLTDELAELHKSLREYQGILTSELQKKIGDKVNLGETFYNYSKDPKHNRKTIGNRVNELVNTYGETHLTPDEVKAVLGDRYDDYKDKQTRYINSDYYKALPVNLQGPNDPEVYSPDKVNWGFRHALEMYRNTGYDTPYQVSSDFAKGMLPKKQMGGTINYEGQLHEGPNGGIPVDQMGNPSNSPVALTEGKEVAYDAGEQGSYVFSDTLKFDKNKTFAETSKKIQSKYKMRGRNRAGNFNVIDPIAKKGYDKEMQELIEKQETLKSVLQPQQEMRELPMARRGGSLPKYNLGGPFVNEDDNSLIYDTWGKYPTNNIVNYDYLKNKTITGQDFGIKGSNKFSTPVDAPTTSQYQGMTGWQTAAAMLPGVTSGLINIARGKRGNREENPYAKLSLPEVQAEQINLERERAALREQANVARANTSRGLRAGAPTAGGYMANMIAGETGIQRGLGQGLGESFTREETANAQMRQQAAMANQQAKMQEQMYNAQLDTQWKAQNDALISGGISQIGQGVTSGLAQRSQSKRDAQMLQMQNPDMYFKKSYNPSTSDNKIWRATQNWGRRNFGQTLNVGVRPEVIARNKQADIDNKLDLILRHEQLGIKLPQELQKFKDEYYGQL